VTAVAWVEAETAIESERETAKRKMAAAAAASWSFPFSRGWTGTDGRRLYRGIVSVVSVIFGDTLWHREGGERVSGYLQ
jgi:hypothetical protein